MADFHSTLSKKAKYDNSCTPTHSFTSVKHNKQKTTNEFIHKKFSSSDIYLISIFFSSPPRFLLEPNLERNDVKASLHIDFFYFSLCLKSVYPTSFFFHPLACSTIEGKIVKEAKMVGE